MYCSQDLVQERQPSDRAEMVDITSPIHVGHAYYSSTKDCNYLTEELLASYRELVSLFHLHQL